MKVLKASTKAGQNILRRAENNEGYFLSQVYDSYSQEKQNAWKWCEHEYLTSDSHSNFHICGHNTFGFSCSWLGTKEGENIMRYETKDNSYLIWLDR